MSQEGSRHTNVGGELKEHGLRLSVFIITVKPKYKVKKDTQNLKSTKSEIQLSTKLVVGNYQKIGAIYLSQMVSKLELLNFGEVGIFTIINSNKLKESELLGDTMGIMLSF
jgi:hypothetical protein